MEMIAGRSPLRLATLSLPTHREVVAAAFRISALVPPDLNEPPAPVRSLLRVCIPRRRDSIITFEELDKLEAMTIARRTKCLCDAKPQPSSLCDAAPGL